MSKKKVLILEDDSKVAESFSMCLKTSKKYVPIVGKPEKIENHLPEMHSYYAVILNLGKGSMGVEKVKEIRNASQKVRIVVVSGATLNDSQAETLATHKAVFVEKPCTQENLILALEKNFSD